MKKHEVITLTLVLVAALWVMSSCDGNGGRGTRHADVDSLSLDSSDVAMGEAVMPEGADDLFDDFVFNFASNARLQLQRIAFPLTVEKDGRKRQLARNQWKTEHFFMGQDYFTIIFNNRNDIELMKDTAVNHAVIEKIFLDEECVQQYLFDRTDGRWMMQRIREVPLSQSVHASFLQFYRRFATDEAFQVESMSATVEFTAPDPDDDFNMMTGTIFPEQWPSFRPSLIPSGLIYNVEYGHLSPDSNTKIFMVRGIANGYETEMTFRKTASGWQLVQFTT